MIPARGQRDFRAEVGCGDFQTQFTVMLWHRLVHMIRINDIGLAGCKAGFHKLLEQRARIHRRADRAVLGALQIPLSAIAHSFHERIGDKHPVMQVQRLAVEIARRFADFEKFFNFRVRNVEIAGRRPATQRPLRNRECQRIHHADKGNNARCLAIETHRLPNAAHRPPIGADAAAAGRQPDILIPGVDDAFQAIIDRIEIAADRQTAPRAAVGQDGRCRHEPEL